MILVIDLRHGGKGCGIYCCCKSTTGLEEEEEEKEKHRELPITLTFSLVNPCQFESKSSNKKCITDKIICLILITHHFLSPLIFITLIHTLPAQQVVVLAARNSEE